MMLQKKIVIKKSNEETIEKNIVIDDSDDSKSDTNDSDSDNEEKMKNRLTNQDFQITTYTVRSVYTDFLEEKSIILRPSYQRALTWSYDKMLYFLDSLYYFPIVPSFIICKIDKEELKEIRKKNKDSSLNYECIDGQHRLTVIKKYIKGKSININGKERMLYIKEKDNATGKDKFIFYKLNQEIENRIIQCKINKKNIRAMTTDERYAFNETQLSFISIKKQIDKNTKCNLFNRLQQGAKVNTGTTTINCDHQISNFLRDNNIIKEEKYDEYWKSIILTKIPSYKYDELINRMTFFTIRLLYITDKNSLDVNYNDQNMALYITKKYKGSNLSDNVDINKIYKKIIDINSTIHKSIEDYKIIEEFYMLIHKLLLDKSPLFANIKLLLSNKELKDKYNNILFYKKSVNSKIVSSEMPKKYNKLLDDLKNLSDKSDTLVVPKKKKIVDNYDDLKI
jgi:hypothetical protein